MHEDMASNAWRVLQRSKELDQGPKEQKLKTLPHPNEMIFWNECLMRSKMKVGRLRTGDAHRQGVKSIKHFF